MSKTNKRPPAVTRTTTHEGGSAYKVRAADELVLTAASTYLGEDTFYEKADVRLARLVGLMHEVTRTQPGTAAQIVDDLRSLYRIRTAALVLAVEYLRAGGPMARRVIDKVVQRPDEPAEMIAYWLTRYGRSIPWAMRRGLADAVARQYTERNVLKYGRNRNALVSPADVIELTHPRPTAPWQGELFRYLLDEAHHGDGIERYVERRQGSSESPELPLIYRSYQLGTQPEGGRRTYLREHGAEALADAGYNWERLAAWLPGGMDAEAWEAVIPTMGVMALLRNLRNFDKVGINRETQDIVEAKITDMVEVARSRVFPYRIYQAYLAAPSDRWKHPLATTLEHSVGNLPAFDRTLFLVDVSGSMTARMSDRSEMARYEVATLMGATAYKAATRSSLALFAANSAEVEGKPGASTLGLALDLIDGVQRHLTPWLGYGRRQLSLPDPLEHLGQGTHLHMAVAHHYDPARHDLVVIFTDDQTFDNASLSAQVPTIVTFNLGGFAPQSDWGKGRIHVSGFSDAAFKAVHHLTQGAE